MTAIPDCHGTTARPSEIVLTNATFDQFIAKLDKPAHAVPELTDLFRRHPKLPER